VKVRRLILQFLWTTWYVVPRGSLWCSCRSAEVRGSR